MGWIGWTESGGEPEGPSVFGIGRSRASAMRGVAVIAAMIGLLIPSLGTAQETQPSVGEAGQVGAISRADSLRALVIERLRAPQEPEGMEGETDVGEGLDVVPSPSPLPGTSPARSRQSSPITPPSGADAYMEGLMRLEGATVSAYEGTRVDFEIPRRNLILWGDEERGSRFMGVGMALSADSSITYDGLLGMIRTRGAAEFTPENGAPVTTHRLVYSLDEGRGTALEAETDYSEGGVSWIVKGNLDSVRDGELFASSTTFTSCDLDHPHSYFKADRIKILADQIMVTGPVKLYFDDVPVLWLPFFVQNLGSGRSSGLLTPVFSVNDVVRSSSGYNRRVGNLGYYWAMSDYSDMTIAGDWYSNEFVALESRLGYRWARRFLVGSVNFKHYWRESGRRDLALNTRHDWTFSERTQLSISGNYVSSSELVLRNSLDPRELTQTIDSDGKMSRRFDWGTLTLGASRKQYLSDERTDMTLPSLSLSLSTLTLFGAPTQTARWYNNVSFSGGGSASRKQLDRAFQPDTAFSFVRASQLLSEGSVRGSLGIGDMSLSASGGYDEDIFRDVPLDRGVVGSPRGDFRAATANWSAGLSYRLRLIGSTTLSPSVSMGATLLQVDSIPEASRFVQGPLRTSVGVGLQTELYGFFGGFGPLEAIRHKIVPSLSWTYSPEVVSTQLQQNVFGAGVSRRINMLTVGLSQTWEGRLSATSDAGGAPAPGTLGGGAQGVGGGVIQGIGVAGDGAVLAVDTLADQAGTSTLGSESGPRRLAPSRTRTLLALSTGGISYDLVRADSTGKFIDGFMTTSISTTINSDYLQGLNLSFTHDLFDDSAFLTEGVRSFAPHLSQLSLGFALSDQSGFIRTLIRLLGGAPGEVRAVPSTEQVSPFGGPPTGVDPFTGYDPNRVIPGTSSYSQTPTRREGWNAQVSYSLRRPRQTDLPQDQGFLAFREPTAQMISTTLSFSPTQLWNVGWVTSYDVEAGRFSDHVVRLTRDLHEWDASFGFRQTPNGNWSFQFEVALKANRDLRFDYEQRSLPGQAGF